jgi:hypothetical protein
MATDAQGRQLSPDGNYYWDMNDYQWHLVDRRPGLGEVGSAADLDSMVTRYEAGTTPSVDAQGRQLSPDGNYYYDGSNWQLVSGVGMATSAGAVGSAPWLPDAAAKKLLGNARPKTYEKCRDDAYWLQLFEAWWGQRSNDTLEIGARYVFDRLWDRSSSESAEDVWNELWAQVPNFALALGPQEPDAPFMLTFDDLESNARSAMEPVYQKFYDDVGRAKEALKAR